MIYEFLNLKKFFVITDLCVFIYKITHTGLFTLDYLLFKHRDE